MRMRNGGFTDFVKLSPELKREVMAVYPKIPLYDLPRFAFRIKPDGHISRTNGEKQLATTEGMWLESAGKSNWEDTVRSKGDLRDWRPGIKFSFSRG